MPRVYGVHEIELKPGVKEEDFEKFVMEEVYPFAWPHQETYLLRGDRGEREGKYLWVIELESVEARDQVYPSPDELSGEAQEFMQSRAATFEKWAAMATGMGETTWTDYVVVGK